ncbi:hypothetical protein HPB47_019272 [Ixodes persulcatus]|uniref:Uncharacterized protein n=1 Tax=Ixodes persulcatus TaxID=34615 RepID=A0AC60QKU8_IXOPE|nr:hypothetical protein HPB47_019272 [Ixodes persulcatus]
MRLCTIAEASPAAYKRATSPAALPTQSFQGECCPCSVQTAQLWEQLSQLERSQAALRHEVEALRAGHRSPARAAAPRAPPPPAPSPTPATLRRPSQRPQSMCEWRQLGAFPNNMPRDDSGLGQMQSGQWSHASGDYDNSLEPLRARILCGNRPSIPICPSPKPKLAEKRQALSLKTKQSIAKDAESGMKNASVAAKYNVADTTVSTVWKNREQVRKQLQQDSASPSRKRIHTSK